jgi:hypothetical protein
MESTSAWVLQYVSHQFAAVPKSWCTAKRTFSRSVHWARDHELLVNSLKPIFGFHGVLGL